MKNGSFIGYHHSDDVHDAILKRVKQDGERLSILIETIDGRSVTFDFSAVQSVEAQDAEGMVLYSISEMQCPPPYRRFVFTNSDEDDQARLEVVAREISRRG